MKLKAMGSAHEHTLAEGDDFGGRVSTRLSKEVVFNRDNNWIVDTDEADISDEAAKVLVESGDFADVTDLERIPLNECQRIFYAMKDPDEAVAAVAEEGEVQVFDPMTGETHAADAAEVEPVVTEEDQEPPQDPPDPEPVVSEVSERPRRRRE